MKIKKNCSKTRIGSRYIFLFYKGDFCGRRKWWFRNPKPKPTPFARNCDNCCEKVPRMKVDFYHHDPASGSSPDKINPPLCSIDLSKEIKTRGRSGNAK